MLSFIKTLYFHRFLFVKLKLQFWSLHAVLSPPVQYAVYAY